MRMANLRHKHRDERDKNIVTVNELSVPEAERLIIGYLEHIGWAAEASDDDDNPRRIACVTSENSVFRLFVSLEPQAAIWSLSQQGRSVLVETRFKQIPNLKKGPRSLLKLVFGIPPLFVFLLLGGVDLPLEVRDARVTISILLTGISLLLVWTYSTRFDEWDFMNGFYRHVYESTGKTPEISQVPWVTNIRAIVLFMIFGFLGIVLNRIGFALVSNPSDPQAPTAAPWSSFALDIPMTACILGMLPLLKSGLSEKWAAHLVSITVGSYLTYYALVPLVLVAVLETSSNILGLRLLGIVLIVFVLAVFTLVSLYVTMDLERRYRARTYAKYADSQRDKSALSLNYLVLGFWGLCAIANILGVYFSLSIFEYLLVGRNQLLPLTQVGALAAAFGKPAMALYCFPMLAILMILTCRWINELLRAMRAEIPEWLERDLERISADLGISKPIVIVSDGIRADAHTSRVLLLGNVLTVTNTTLKLLTADELSAVLAHELWHFKKHSFLFSFLDSLSRWSLFGKGFLTVLLNTKEMEYQADEDAVRYLVRTGMAEGSAKRVYASALNRIVIHNTLARLKSGSKWPLSIDAAHTTSRQADAEMKLSLSTRLQILYKVYFGDVMWWYAHPSSDERIRRLEVTR